MPSDVQAQIDLLLIVRNLASRPYIGASDRKRAIATIRELCDRNLNYETQTDNTTGTFITLLSKLTEWGLLDANGHKPNCGYSEDNPACGCAKMGEELHAFIKG